MTGTCANAVYVVNGSQVAGSLSGFNNPIGMSFDTTGSEMFVVNAGNNTVTALSLSSGLSSTAAVGSSPREALFDPALGMVLVTNYGGSTVSLLPL